MVVLEGRRKRSSDTASTGAMVKHLEKDWEVSHVPANFLAHMQYTVDQLGGSLGIGALALVLFLFYQFVIFMVERGRARRMAAKRNSRKGR